MKRNICKVVVLGTAIRIMMYPVMGWALPETSSSLPEDQDPPKRVEAWIQTVVAGQDILPSLKEVLAAAVASMELSDLTTLERLGARARYRGWVPQVRTRFGTSRNLSVRTGEPEVVDWVRSGQGLGIDIVLQWKLPEVVFSEVEVRLESARMARSKAVGRIKEQATKLYFDRVRVLLEYRNQPSEAAAWQGARLDGLLISLTGGRLQIPRRRS